MLSAPLDFRYPSVSYWNYLFQAETYTKSTVGDSRKIEYVLYKH